MELADGNLLVIGFDTSWPDLFSALEEVQDSLHPGNINRVAINPDGQVVAWLGGRSAYDGHA